MPELVYVALATAALGLVLALTALVMIRRMRREDARPRLSTKLSWLDIEGLPAGTVRLDIWNSGRTPVTVKKIHMVWHDGDNVKQGNGSIGFTPYDPYTRSRSQTVAGHSLQPCEGRAFVLPPLPPAMMRNPAELPEDKVWICIDGESGELARIDGRLLKPLLENYLRL